MSQHTGRTIIHVVIPCYNPPVGWVGVLVYRIGQLKQAAHPEDLRLILVNDGSTQGLRSEDRDLVLAAFPGSSWLEHPVNKGKGAALRTGVMAAQGSPVLFTDVDVPYTVPSMISVIEGMRSGSDVVLGHRSDRYYERVPPLRRFISRMFRFVLKRLLGFVISDTQCGLKGFNAKGAALFLSTTVRRFLFDMEFVMLASRRKDLRITTVEAELNEGVTFTRMGVGTLVREAFNFLALLARSARQG